MIKAVVICEDHRLDEHIIKPVLKQAFRDAGQQVKIQFVTNSLIRGLNQALRKSSHKEVFDRYPMADLFFLIVDRDCDENRENGKFADRLSEAKTSGMTMIGCLAIEELEVWPLALHRKDNDLKGDWTSIQKHCHPKEAYFEPFARLKNWHTGPGKGRIAAMKPMRGKWGRLKNSCPKVKRHCPLPV